MIGMEDVEMNQKPEITKEDKSTCSFCGQEGVCLSRGNVKICLKCLKKAERAAAEPEQVLKGTVKCHNCKGTTFSVTELVCYDQVRGKLIPSWSMLDDNPRVRCVACGAEQDGPNAMTVLHRVTESPSSAKYSL